MPGHVRDLPGSFRLSRDDFYPVAVGILDKIDAHRFIFKANAPHFLMTGMRGFHIIYRKGQVEFIIPQIIGILFPVSQPG